jgi:hypothetical protein
MGKEYALVFGKGFETKKFPLALQRPTCKPLFSYKFMHPLPIANCLLLTRSSFLT